MYFPYFSRQNRAVNQRFDHPSWRDGLLFPFQKPGRRSESFAIGPLKPGFGVPVLPDKESGSDSVQKFKFFARFHIPDLPGCFPGKKRIPDSSFV